MQVIKTHVEAALLRGVAAAARLDLDDREKPILVVEEICTMDWASATFVGARITMALRLEGMPDAVETALGNLAERLPDWEFRIAGQIVADIGLLEDWHDSDPSGRISAEAGRVPSFGPSTVSRPFVVEALTVLD